MSQHLAEQSKKAFDTDTSAKLEAKFASGEDFTSGRFLRAIAGDVQDGQHV